MSRRALLGLEIGQLSMGAKAARPVDPPDRKKRFPTGDACWRPPVIDRTVVTPDAAAMDPSSDRLEGAPAEPPGRTCTGPAVVSGSMPMRELG